jgi:hypothetical protein
MPVTPSAPMSRNREREIAFSCYGNSSFSRDSQFFIDLSCATKLDENRREIGEKVKK